MKKAKSLLIFIPSIENGGVEKNLYLIANYLAKTNLSVKILTAFEDKKKLFDKKIRIISLKKTNIIIKSRLIKTLITIGVIKKNFLNLFLNSLLFTIISSARLKKNLIINFLMVFFIYFSGLVFDLTITFLLKINPNKIATMFD